MKKSTNIQYTVLSSTLSYKNVDKYHTKAYEKQYFSFDDDSPRMNLATQHKERQDIMEQIDEILHMRDDVQVPIMYFKDIHLHLKKKQSKFSTLINSIFKDHFVKSTKGKSQYLISYQVCWKSTVEYIYEVNLTLEHLKSLYISVYFFNKLNEISYQQIDSKTMKIQQFNTNLLVALNLSGKLCQIYPYNLNDIIQLTQIYIPFENVIRKQSELLKSIDWRLIPVSQFEYFGLYHILCNVNKHQQVYANKLMATSLGNLKLIEQQPSTKAIAVIIALKQTMTNSKITQFFEKLILFNSIQKSELYKVIIQYKLILKQIIKQEHFQYKKDTVKPT